MVFYDGTFLTYKLYRIIAPSTSAIAGIISSKSDLPSPEIGGLGVGDVPAIDALF